ncbi:MAG: 2Fe-2S iron-sulfur cluster-binding protein [Terracidiphilus sp.]
MPSDRVRIRLEPVAVEFDVPSAGSLAASLATHGVEFPCGGVGECGGCGVRLLSGSLPVTDADSGILTPGQLDAGWRFACQARASSPLVLECAQWRMEILADNATVPAAQPTAAIKHGLSIAVDLGTATIAA